MDFIFQQLSNFKQINARAFHVFQDISIEFIFKVKYKIQLFYKK